MSWLKTYLKSSVGAKHVMAITGIGLSLFLLVHMLGNLLVLVGRDAINTYGDNLQGNQALVWVARAGLLSAVLVHIAAALRLTALNKAARPVKYHVFKPKASPFYARVMPMSGLILFAFIVFHILHFTTGTVMADNFDSWEVIDKASGMARHDIYSMVVLSFQNAGVALSYVVAMALLCMHLAHGVSSFFQSLGLNHPKYRNFTQHRGPGRHQRRQELPERRRQRVPAVLRHGQGRRLPLARGQRLPAGRGQREHHRPVRGPGRALRPGVRRHPGQPLLRRRPGLAHLLRPGQTGQQLLARRLPGLSRQIGAGKVRCSPAPRCSTWSSSTAAPRASSPATWSRARSSASAADAVVLATGGYGNVFYLSTNAKGCNVTAAWRAHKRGRRFANPCYTQIHPTCIPVTGDYQSKLTLMSESLRNDGRIWVPKRPGLRRAPPGEIPEEERDYYLERKYPSFGNLAPRDIASRNAKEVCDDGRGVGPVTGGTGVYLDFADAIGRLGEDVIAALRQPVRHVRASPERIPTRCRCASTPPSTTPWAACGWTTT